MPRCDCCIQRFYDDLDKTQTKTQTKPDKTRQKRRRKMIQDWTKDPEQLALFERRSNAAGINRRDFFKILAGASAAVALAACAPSPGAQPASSGAAAPAAPAAADAAVPDAEQVFREPFSFE